MSKEELKKAGKPINNYTPPEQDESFLKLGQTVHIVEGNHAGRQAKVIKQVNE